MDKKKVFVIMPFKDEFFEVYEMLKCNFLKDLNSAMPEKKEISKILSIFW